MKSERKLKHRKNNGLIKLLLKILHRKLLKLAYTPMNEFFHFVLMKNIDAWKR